MVKKYWGLIVIGVASVFVLAGMVDFVFGGTARVQYGGSGTVRTQFGGSGTVRSQFASADACSGSFPEVLFYFSCDDDTNGISPDKGVGTLGISSSISTATAMGANSTKALLTTNNNFTSIQMSSGNVNTSEGCWSFYVNVQTDDAGYLINPKDSEAESDDWVSNRTSAETYTFRYSNVSITHGLTTNTTHYLEWCWDITETDGYCHRVRTDNGTWTEGSGCTAGAPTPIDANMSVGSDPTVGSSVHMKVDEMIITNDRDSNNYAIRDCGSYPD